MSVKVDSEEQQKGKATELKAKIMVEIERIRGMEARERAKQEEREKKDMEEEAGSIEGSIVESERHLGEGNVQILVDEFKICRRNTLSSKVKTLTSTKSKDKIHKSLITGMLLNFLVHSINVSLQHAR